MATLMELRNAFPEISDFLSQEECSHLIQLALDEGLKSSITHKQEEDSDFKGHIKLMDLDSNKKLTIGEVDFFCYFDPELLEGNLSLCT